jgi:hypothetical protein
MIFDFHTLTGWGLFYAAGMTENENRKPWPLLLQKISKGMANPSQQEVSHGKTQ